MGCGAAEATCLALFALLLSTLVCCHGLFCVSLIIQFHPPPPIGSERVAKTDSKAERLKEAQAINKVIGYFPLSHIYDISPSLSHIYDISRCQPLVTSFSRYPPKPVTCPSETQN